MNAPQVLGLFCREALLSLRRSWKVSLLAVFTIAASLFIGGTFLLLTGNLTQVVADWRSQAKVVAYLAPQLESSDREALEAWLRQRPWTTEVVLVTAQEAEERFVEAFPSLEELLLGWDDRPLPASLEISVEPEGLSDDQFRSWVTELRARTGVSMVDDDREWLRQIGRLVAVLRGAGVLVGGILLTAAVFTIASVIRLTAYLYRDEIAVMRLVGATEFVVQGPFYVGGVLQGLLGGALAVGSLFAAFRLLAVQEMPLVFGTVLFDRFLSIGSLVGIVAVGAVAGLLGAVFSMEREKKNASDRRPV